MIVQEKITIPPRVLTRTFDAEFTAVANLTKSFVRGAAQLSMDPGWQDPSANETTDTGGNGAKVRTNQPGAGFKIGWTGQKAVAIAFDNIYSTKNANGKPWRMQLPYCAVRVKKDGVWGAWTDGVRPTIGPSGGLFFHDCDEDSVYEAEIIITHFYDPVGGGSLGAFARLEYMRPIEAFPGGSDAGDGLLVEQGGWVQIGGLWGTGGTFNTVDDTATPALKVVVLSDSRGVGQIDWEQGEPFVEIARPLATDGRKTNYDSKGVRRAFWRQLLDAWCTAQNRRLVGSFASYGGLWVGQMSATTRWAYLSTHPGLAANVRDGGFLRNRYTTGSFPSYTVKGRPLPSGWTPDLVIIDLGTNDGVIADALIVAPDPIGDGTQREFGGTTFRDDFVTTVQSLRTRWASAKFFIANTQRADGPTGGYVFPIDTKTRLHEACGPSYLNIDALRSGSPASWGRYVDLEAANACPKTSIHPTGPEHDALATYAATAFNALMAL